MQNEELFYDTNEAIKFISEWTDVDSNIIEKVLDADVEFMRKIGIIKDEEGWLVLFFFTSLLVTG